MLTAITVQNEIVFYSNWITPVTRVGQWVPLALDNITLFFGDLFSWSPVPLAPETPPQSFFWCGRQSKPRNISGTVAILAQGTSWAVAGTQAFLTRVRFPLGSWPLASLAFPNARKSWCIKFALFLQPMITNIDQLFTQHCATKAITVSSFRAAKNNVTFGSKSQ